jgi:hypothetical protein
MDADIQRRTENFLIVCPLKDIEDGDILAALGSLIQNHDHLREKLLTEPNLRKRQEKLDAMRPHLRFKALSLDHYHMAEVARSCGSQPIYQEQESMGRIIMPESRIHEVMT